MMTSRIQRILVCAAIVGAVVLGQAGSTLGVVTKIDATARQIVLKTDAGAEITIVMQPTASFRRGGAGRNRPPQRFPPLRSPTSVQAIGCWREAELPTIRNPLRPR